MTADFHAISGPSYFLNIPNFLDAGLIALCLFWAISGAEAESQVVPLAVFAFVQICCKCQVSNFKGSYEECRVFEQYEYICYIQMFRDACGDDVDKDIGDVQCSWSHTNLYNNRFL